MLLTCVRKGCWSWEDLSCCFLCWTTPPGKEATQEFAYVGAHGWAVHVQAEYPKEQKPKEARTRANMASEQTHSKKEQGSCLQLEMLRFAYRNGWLKTPSVMGVLRRSDLLRDLDSRTVNVMSMSCHINLEGALTGRPPSGR